MGSRRFPSFSFAQRINIVIHVSPFSGEEGLPFSLVVGDCPYCENFAFLSKTEKDRHMKVLHHDKKFNPFFVKLAFFLPSSLKNVFLSPCNTKTFSVSQKSRSKILCCSFLMNKLRFYKTFVITSLVSISKVIVHCSCFFFVTLF